MAGKIAITISAVDQASVQLEAINKRIAAMMAPVERLQKSFGRFADASGVTKLSKGFTDLGRGSLDAFRNISRVVEPLAAITGAASIAGMVKLTERWANFGSQLGFSAQRLAMTASALQTYQGAAVLAGSSTSALTTGMQTLGQNMWNAVGGRAPDVTAAFRYLHLSFQNADGSARSLGDMMPKIADKIKGIQNPFAQAAVATALFGGAAEDLLPFLRLGSAGMATYNAQATRYGVLNAAGVTAANNMRMAQAGLTLAVLGLGNAVAQRLAPVLDPMINNLANWIAANRGIIAQDVTGYVQKFSKWLGVVDPQIRGIVNLFGGWGNAARDLAVFMGISWLAKMMAPILTVTTALARVVSLMATASGVPVASLLGTAGVGAAVVLGGAGLALGAAALTGEKVKLSPAQQGVRSAGMNYFMSQGWSKAHAAAILGNVQAESGFIPTADSVDRRTGLHHRGLFQDDPTRWAALTAWAKTSNPTALQQFQFAQSELLSHPSWVAALHNSPNAGAGAMAFNDNFERSGDDLAHVARRASNAQYIFGLNDYGPAGPAANIGNGAPISGGAAGGVVKVDITHTNAPTGTTTKATASGSGVAVGSLKIVKSMAGGSL